MDADPGGRSAGDLLDVVAIRRDHRIATAKRAFGDGDVDHVVDPASSRQRADGAGLLLAERLHPATTQ